jgi:hypothetical protein
MMGDSNLMMGLRLAGAAAAGAAAAIVALKLMERSRASTPQQPNRAPGALAAAGKLTRRGVQMLTLLLACPAVPDKSLLAEQFSRNISFFGDEGFEAFSNSFVVVVGLGGVGECALDRGLRARFLHVVFVIAGSHCTNMLARAGAGKLRLVDFDQVTLSSLNRHAVATLADVGMPKASALKSHLQRIVPNCIIDERSAARGTEEPCLMNDLLRFAERKCSQSLQQTVFSLVFAERCFTARFLCCNVVHSGQANLTT